MWMQLSWHTLLSAASLVPLVLLCLQCCLLICVVAELKKSPSSNLTKAEIKDFETTNGKLGLLNIIFAKEKSSLQTAQRYMAVILMLGICSSILWAKSTYKQRASCSASGDFFESDNVHILGPDRWENSWKYVGKDGREGTIVLCPSSRLSLQAGNVITYARYEYRDGCLDFSSKEASFQVK